MTTNEIKVITSPQGRVINASLFERDTYTDPQGTVGLPSYKLEMVFAPDTVQGEGSGGVLTLEDELYNYADEKWGEGAGDDFLEGRIRSPLLDGNKVAARREKRGKPGGAYADTVVIRAHTKFNKHGEDAPGGVQVWDENVEEIAAVNREKVYSGCYGVMALTIGSYETKDHEGDEMHALMFYLSAFQKTEDGERLATSKDTSTLFEKVGRTKGKASKRRSRKG